MKNLKEQISLYKERNDIKKSIRILSISKIQWQNIKRFIFGHKKTIKLILILISTITLIEVFVPIFLDGFLEKYSYRLNLINFYKSLVVLVLVLIFYLSLYYYNIKFQKKLTLDFINDLRRKWLAIFFNKSISGLKDNDKSRLLVKITYHFSLLQIGLGNCLFLSFQWLFLTCGTIIASVFIDPNLVIISLVGTLINLIVFYLAYVFSVYYVSQDQTLYSKILQYVSDSMNDFYFQKFHHREKIFFNNLDTLVEVDTHLRVQREIMLSLGDRIIFAVLIIVSALSYIAGIYFKFFNFNNALTGAAYFLIFVLLTRLLYLSLRIGLYYFPLKLGLIISVPDKFVDGKNLNAPPISNIRKIKFQTKKFRFRKDLPYIKNIEYIFEKGKKYLITGANNSGKSLLANIFAGSTSSSTGKPWVININDQRRFLYPKWFKNRKEIYYITPHFTSNLNIFEILKNGEFVNENIFDEIQNKLVKYQGLPSLNFIFNHKKFVDQYINNKCFSFSETAIIQMLYCIIHKPSVVIIDNLWLDLDNANVNEVMKIMIEELKDKIVINFSTRDNNLIEYDKKYSI
jgi:ABC-type multidrug transport system fused ATPase/permease subunit